MYSIFHARGGIFYKVFILLILKGFFWETPRGLAPVFMPCMILGRNSIFLQLLCISARVCF
jgi:hypothetical protein